MAEVEWNPCRGQPLVSPGCLTCRPTRAPALATLAANAVYGFTGTNVSPLQCVEVGDACLAYGRQGCE